jgi:hypothetical protein
METRPTTEQIRFVSAKTGTHILDTYLEACERDGRSLPAMIDELYDGNGNLRADLFQFRFKETAPQGIEYRIGTHIDPEDGWVLAESTVLQDISTFFSDYMDDFNEFKEAYAALGGLYAFSNSSVLIDIGDVSFVVGPEKGFLPGMWVQAISIADPSEPSLFGPVVSYDGNTLVVNSQYTLGSGTHSSWDIRISGPRGPQGDGGIGLTASSVTSTAIGTGAKTFTIEPDKNFVPGMLLQVISTSSPSNSMFGSVTSYTGSTLVMDITSVLGSGTFASWAIKVSGLRGPQGDSGTVTDGNKGDITVSSSGTNWLVNNTAITNAKLANMAGRSVKLRAATGSGAPTDLTMGENSLIIRSGSGDISSHGVSTNSLIGRSGFNGLWSQTLNANSVFGRSGSGDLTSIAISTGLAFSGNNLTVDTNTIATKAYVDAAGGSGWVPLQTQTVTTAVSSVDFTGIDGTYKTYAIKINSVFLSVSGSLNLQTSNNNGSSYDSGASDYSYVINSENTSANSAARVGSETLINLHRQFFSTLSTNSLNGILYLYDPANTTYFTAVSGMFAYEASSSGLHNDVLAGLRKSAGAVNAIRFFPSSGNITAGTFTLYGLKDAP